MSFQIVLPTVSLHLGQVNLRNCCTFWVPKDFISFKLSATSMNGHVVSVFSGVVSHDADLEGTAFLILCFLHTDNAGLVVLGFVFRRLNCPRLCIHGAAI